MKIAIPCVDGKLAMHFGHCREFAIVEVNDQSHEIITTRMIPAPDHQPGLLPRWLHEQGANVIIAGGMGSRAQSLFTEQDITVVTGAPADEPEKLVSDYCAGKLETGGNMCDH